MVRILACKRSGLPEDHHWTRDVANVGSNPFVHVRKSEDLHVSKRLCCQHRKPTVSSTTSNYLNLASKQLFLGATRTVLDDHLVVATRAERTGLASTLALGMPAPRRLRMLATLRLATTTTMRMVDAERVMKCQRPLDVNCDRTYAFCAIPRTCGRLPSQRLRPALPTLRWLCSGFETLPIVAGHLA